MSRQYVLIVFLILAACYSADLDNPLDPVRTPAVTLIDVVFDDAAQTATLTWTPYKGTELARRYEIERSEPGADPTIIATVGTIADTTAALPGSSALYAVSVRRLTALDSGFLPTVPHGSAVAFA